jgi:Ca2+/Na+ antiporter
MARVRVRLDDAGDGNLPHVCMYCGEETDETTLKTLRWQPPWLGVVLLVGLLGCIVPAIVVYIVVGLVFQKKAVIQAPLCDDHQGHWTNRSLLVVGSFLCFAVLAALANYVFYSLARPGFDFTSIAMILTLVLLVAWIVIAVKAQNSTIQAEEITDREIVIKGVCKEFVSAIAEVEKTRRERVSQAIALDDDVPKKPRPAKKPPTQAIQVKTPMKKKAPPDAIEE